jgi:hypothetical protein
LADQPDSLHPQFLKNTKHLLTQRRCEIGLHFGRQSYNGGRDTCGGLDPTKYRVFIEITALEKNSKTTSRAGRILEKEVAKT